MPGPPLAILSFPTVVLTVPLLLVLAYWLLVVAGAFELPSGEGLAEGAAEGASEGALEGASGGLASILSGLQLRAAPASVVLSLLVLFGWLFCALAVEAFGPVGLLAGVAVLGGALLAALPPTALLARLVGRFFVVHGARRHGELIGKECVICTGRADRGFGQAKLFDGGAELILPVRCDSPGGLARGMYAVILGYDSERRAFVVESLSGLLASRARVVAGGAVDPEAPGGEVDEVPRPIKKEEAQR